jgi:hypothetical protein
MKRILLVSIFCFSTSILSAQDGAWKLKGMFGATYNETAISTNWSGPDKNARNWGIKLDASAEKDMEKTNWLTSLKEEYGKASISGSAEQISADLIDLSSIYSWKWSVVVNPYVAGIVTTQNTDILYPAAYSESAGVGFNIIS